MLNSIQTQSKIRNVFELLCYIGSSRRWNGGRDGFRWFRYGTSLRARLGHHLGRLSRSLVKAVSPPSRFFFFHFPAFPRFLRTDSLHRRKAIKATYGESEEWSE